MKIALIVPNNLWVCPYVSIYTRLLDELCIDYETISWNREGREESGIQFNKKEKGHGLFRTLLSFLQYSRFVKKTIKVNSYDKLIVFTPQIGIFLSFFLKKHFKGRFIFDYRDLSIEQHSWFRRPFLRLLSNSYANIISSPGFKKYLPHEFNYILSHNYNAAKVKEALNIQKEAYTGSEINLLTIGAIRKDCNYEVIEALGNVKGISLSFIGRGPASNSLQSFADENGFCNIHFSGYYKKEDEPALYKSSTAVNIIYPNIPSHQTAISNRFYNSLIYKRPMIVTRNSTQGDYAEKYKVGLVVDDCKNLETQLKTYFENLDYDNYCRSCNQLLEVLLKDEVKFEGVVRSFLKEN